MGPWVVLAAGVVVVVGGILWLRVPPFVALVVAALIVGAASDPLAARRYLMDRVAGEVLAQKNPILPNSARQVLVRLPQQTAAQPGMVLWSYPRQWPMPLQNPQARLVLLTPKEPANQQWIARVVQGSVEVADRVVHPNQWRQVRQQMEQPVAVRVAEAMGKTFGRIGLLIALAAVVGRVMLESGAARAVVDALTRWLGETRAALAFLVGGFVLGIPVFFDTVFFLMIPLGKALGIKHPRRYLLYVLSIVAGGTMAHSLVPPTPGPLFVAEELGVDLGTMILGGCVVGAFCAAYGYLHAHWANRRWPVPVRDEAEVSAPKQKGPEGPRPPVALAALPILLPVALLVAGSLTKQLVPDEVPQPWNTIAQLVVALGEKNLALLVAAAAALALWLLWHRPARQTVQQVLQQALSSAGMIILITSAGGAFGAMLQQSGIALEVQRLVPQASAWWLLPVAFGITTLVRTAQGSATVAMITAVGIVAGPAQQLQLPYHPLYLALAIGAGSKPLAWMNDSGFWVICRMSGMSEAEALKTLTPMTAIMGVVGLAVVMLGAWLVPLVP